MKKPRGYWTYEKCKEAALLCKTKIELKKTYNAAYNIINKNNWVELTSNLIEVIKPKGYWTYEKCKDISLSCKTKSELRKKYNSVYQKIIKNKWIELTYHMKNIGNKCKRLIYVYEFADNHCYVGLTSNIDRRNNQHYGRLKHHKRSSVFKYMKQSNLIPTLILKTDYIDVDDAILMEEKILNEYKNNGWIILNKIKTGGIGSIGIKWTKESCMDEIKKYKTLNDFIKYSNSVCVTIYKNKWTEILEPIRERRKNNFWIDKEQCRIESLKYKTMSELNKKCYGCYAFSKKNNWLDEFFPKRIKQYKRGHFNNKELCKTEAKKYKNKYNFSIGCKTAYRYSKINNWLDEFFPKKIKKW